MARGARVLFAGLTNAHSHVHYCFDGQEPPASVHLVDGTDHDHEMPGHSDGAEHDDLDLDVPNQALAKACKHDLPAIAMHVWAMSIESRPSARWPTAPTFLPPPTHPTPVRSCAHRRADP